MKRTLWLGALAASLVLAGCGRDQTPAPPKAKDAQSAPGGTAGQTPSGGATGQASEGSTDDRKAPQRPSSK